jgi:pimeloyl-ACP methyl ester carboxylesterase
VLVVVLVLAAFRLAAGWRERETAVPAQTTMLQTNAGRIAVQLSGQPEGTPILLVGGTAGWSGFWRDVAHDLAARGFRVVAIDLPPFGFSDHDPDKRYDRVRQAERILAVLHASAGDRPAILVGHSYGAGPALEASLRARAKIRRLVLVDAALGGLDIPARPASWPLRQQPIAEAAVATGFTNPWAMPPMLRSLLAKKDAADPWIETLRQPMRRPGSTAAYAAWLPNLFATDDNALSRRSAALSAIGVPVSLIWGEADTVTPIAQGEEIAKLVGARAIHRLPGVGHIPHIEDPARFLTALDAAIEDRP